MKTTWQHEANEEAVQSFFARWDPAWRWILILGLRELRRDPVALGRLASAEADESEGWSTETYAYGPLAAGITAAAVNEAAQHCEDLFALLRFLREPTGFAKAMGSYAAGKVIDFGGRLSTADDAAISRLFLIPTREVVRTGLQEAADTEGAIAAADGGRARLADMVRRVADFYETFKDFHNQYKHGLKLPLRPFGEPTQDAIAERKVGVRSSLFMWSTEPIAASVRRQDAAMMFVLGPHQQAHLSKLVDERNVMRLRLAHNVDLDEIAELAYMVMSLLRTAAHNRLALGQLEDGNQSFAVPGKARWEQVDVRIRLDRSLSLDDFCDPPPKRR